MQKFGTVCYAYRQDRKKLDSKSDKGVFVRYVKNSLAYIVYYPDSRKVVKHWLVRFMTNVDGQETNDVSDDNDVGVQYIAQPDLTLTNPNSVTSETKPGLSSQISLQPAEVKLESHSPDMQRRGDTLVERDEITEG